MELRHLQDQYRQRQYPLRYLEERRSAQREGCYMGGNRLDSSVIDLRYHLKRTSRKRIDKAEGNENVPRLIISRVLGRIASLPSLRTHY